MLNLDRERFLSHYWQRQPLLIEHAHPDTGALLSPEELAGLSLEPDVESRIIAFDDPQWTLEHGPMQDTSFQRTVPWTLLVQAVDHTVDAVAELRKRVDFLPGWRTDDVMVSYANDGGSVGPHFDNYDVFLLQGAGTREWRIGQYCSNDEPLIDHDELRILADFRERERFILNPGDVLYLPPRLAHWGVARGECMTYSIGFRAPRVNDMLSRWIDQVLEQMEPELFYRDPVDASELRPGEISPTALQEAQRLLRHALDAQAEDSRWFGELVTEPRYTPEPLAADQIIDSWSSLALDPAAKLAWIDHGTHLMVFANGDSFSCPSQCRALLETLCENWRVSGADLSYSLQTEERRELLQSLMELGCLLGDD